MSRSLLADRAILAVSGDEAEALLNRLVTRSVAEMPAGSSEARYAALLSPQGKLQFDFLLYRPGQNEFWIDVSRAIAAELARKLTMFKLRAKVIIAPREEFAVAAAWGGAPAETTGAVFRDPRHEDLGHRIVVDRGGAEAVFGADDAAYAAHRIGLGVPQGGVDFVYGDTFVHDANLDLLHGVDFDKGCYVGQEVVSRVHHRASVRKRIVRLAFLGDPPAAGTTLTAGGVQIGYVTSVAGRVGLATARLDRLEEAATAAAPVTAGETLVTVNPPEASAVLPSAAFHDAD